MVLSHQPLHCCAVLVALQALIVIKNEDSCKLDCNYLPHWLKDEFVRGLWAAHASENA
jgi:hypothetical protein